MATGTAPSYFEDLINLDPAVREIMDRDSDRITDNYNTLTEEEYELGFPEPEQAAEPEGLSQTEIQFAQDSRKVLICMTLCAMAVFGSFCLWMFMMVNGRSAREQLNTQTSLLSSLQQEQIRLETEIKGKSEIGAVARYAESMGLHKASQFQTIYVGGKAESGGITSNAAPEDDDSGRLWRMLNSLFD